MPKKHKHRKKAWKALWAEFDKWSEEKEPFPAWPTQQTKIRELVQSQIVPGGVTVQWRRVWEGFNAFYEEAADWEVQKRYITDLVEEEINRQWQKWDK